MRKTLLLALTSLVVNTAIAAEIHWVPFSEDAFKKAAQEKKLVVLDLEAVWCHWCHVMEKETYSNPKVQDIINSKFIAIRTDQDSRPDLSTRYQDYGWPATIILNAKGEDLAKKSGFIPAEEFAALLTQLVNNPVPQASETVVEVSGAPSSSIAPDLRQELIKRHKDKTDRELGGLKTSHKYLDNDTLEFAIQNGRAGDQDEERYAKLSLANNRKILDPIWGGVYQYSTNGDWEHPHFEKIMAAQARGMRIYSAAYLAWRNPDDLAAAKSIFGYVKDFLTSPEGAFYTSQDADVIRGTHSDEYFKLDDAGRRKQGIPVIDKHSYSRENGWMIEALTALYVTSGDKAHIDAAIKAAEWVIANRSLPGGGFRHDASDPNGPYLGDTLAMGRGFVGIYHVTGERRWLTLAVNAGKFIAAHFVEANKLGYLSSDPKTAGLVRPVRLNDENIVASRFFNMLHHYTGDESFKSLAGIGLGFLGSPKIALTYVTEPGILLADNELTNPPLHITVVGNKDDTAAQSLIRAGLEYPNFYKRLEWWDKREGPMPNPDVEYPQLPKSAAFICTNKRCSLPIFAPEGIAKTIDLFGKKKV